MRTSLQKWGNSLGLRIPKVVAEETGFRSGTVVELVREGDAIVVRAIRKRKRVYALEDLVAKITSNNRHVEVSSGRRRGREVW